MWGKSYKTLPVTKKENQNFSGRQEELEAELKQSNQDLQNSREEMQNSQEELKSINE